MLFGGIRSISILDLILLNSGFKKSRSHKLIGYDMNDVGLKCGDTLKNTRGGSHFRPEGD